MTRIKLFFWNAVHNLIAHPLLVIAPPLGAMLHDWSADKWTALLTDGQRDNLDAETERAMQTRPAETVRVIGDMLRDELLYGPRGFTNQEYIDHVRNHAMWRGHMLEINPQVSEL